MFDAQVFLVRARYPGPQHCPQERTRKTQRERAVTARMYQRRRLREGLQGRARDLEEPLGWTPHVRAAVGYAADSIMEVAGEAERLPS